MNRLSRIRVEGFRRLQALDLELRPLNVVIGANGSGKTSLLDVFALLAASAAGRLKEKVSELGGMSQILTIDRSKECTIGLSIGDGGGNPFKAPTAYQLTIVPREISYEIVKEVLSCWDFGPCGSIESHNGDVKYIAANNSQAIAPDWGFDFLETALSQVPKALREPDEFRVRLASSTFYHMLDVEARAPIRTPQQLRPATLPGRNGEDLVSCLFNIREAYGDRFEAIVDALHAAFPGFDRLDFPPVAAGVIAMTWKDSRFSRPLYMSQLSEGTLRFLWLATLLQSPGLSAVTLLDEPEVSLHPELLSLLAGLMREASDRTQLVVATQSDALVRFLEPKEVLAMDLAEDGTAQARWADEFDIEEWLKDYTLDEVWRMGRIGGRVGGQE
jgi:predicted ATPase